MDNYFHGRGIKPQLISGVRFASRFLISSDFAKSNSSEMYVEIGLCLSVQAQTVKIVVSA
jgi:hypothetical protein